MDSESLQAIVNIISTLGGQASTAFIVWVVAKVAGNWITILIVGGFILSIVTKIIGAILESENDTAAIKNLRRIVFPNATGYVDSNERQQIIVACMDALRNRKA